MKFQGGRIFRPLEPCLSGGSKCTPEPPISKNQKLSSWKVWDSLVCSYWSLDQTLFINQYPKIWYLSLQDEIRNSVRQPYWKPKTFRNGLYLHVIPLGYDMRLCVHKRRKRQNEVLSKLASKLSTENAHGIGQNI